MGTLKLQWTGNLFSLCKTCINIGPFSLISSVSENFDGYSLVKLQF